MKEEQCKIHRSPLAEVAVVKKLLQKRKKSLHQPKVREKRAALQTIFTIYKLTHYLTIYYNIY